MVACLTAMVSGFRAFFRTRGDRSCGCGHVAQAHEHYRRGTDCAMCDCLRFRAGSSVTATGAGTDPVPEPMSRPVPQPVASEVAHDRVTSTPLAS